MKVGQPSYINLVKLGIGMARAINQQVDRLEKIWSGVLVTARELIQFYEFFQEVELTFPDACGEFLGGTEIQANAPIFTMHMAYKNGTITSIAKLHDKDKNAASLPNALDILFRKDIEMHLRSVIAGEDFDENMDIVRSLGRELPKDHRYAAARYFRDKLIAHNDVRFNASAYSLSRHDLGTVYLFTISIIEAVNKLLNITPKSYTRVMNEWIIMASHFMQSIPHHGKASPSERKRMEAFYLGTREEFEKSLEVKAGD